MSFFHPVSHVCTLLLFLASLFQPIQPGFPMTKLVSVFAVFVNTATNPVFAALPAQGCISGLSRLEAAICGTELRFAAQLHFAALLARSYISPLSRLGEAFCGPNSTSTTRVGLTEPHQYCLESFNHCPPCSVLVSSLYRNPWDFISTPVSG